MKQQEIDELLQSSDEEPLPKNKKASKKIQDNYDDDFWDESEPEKLKTPKISKKEQISQQVLDDYSVEFEQEIPEGEQLQGEISERSIVESNHIVSEKKSGELDEVSQIQSEQFESQVHDEVAEDLNQEDQDWFKKDDSLSVAQSEFIQSSNMNNSQVDKNKAKLNTLLSQQKKQKKKSGAATNQTKPKIERPKIEKPKVTKDVKKPVTKKNVEKKPSEKMSKFTQEEIQQKMLKIKEQKERLQKIKKEKEQKQKDKKKEQYEAALAKEKQKKEKNKQIFEQQKNKKKQAIKNDSQKNSKALAQKIEQEATKQIKEKKVVNDGITKQTIAKRKIAQKQIEKAIVEKNKKKLKELQPVVISKKVEGEEKKKTFWKNAKDLQQAQVKEKKKQNSEVDTVLIKQIKHEIKEQTKQNRNKRSKIFEFEKQIEQLKSKLKGKQKVFYKKFQPDSQKIHEEIYTTINFSDLSPVEKFVSFFPEAQAPSEIFNILDDNQDGILTLTQIQSKIIDLGIETTIIKQLHQLLDANSDGNITLQEFQFIIDQEIKKQRDYREIMQGVDIVDPLEIQAQIIDMRAKIIFMEKQIQKQRQEGEDAYAQKYKFYLQKWQKIQKKIKIEKQKIHPNQNTSLESNALFLLSQNAEKLKAQQAILTKILNSLNKTITSNLEQKNKILLAKVQENMRLKEKIYRIKNDLQETQLRYLSMRKIKQNKKGYLERQNKARMEMEDIYRKAKEYQLKVTDPTKQIKNKTHYSQIKFLAAVIMIQRNFRKRKAQRMAAQMKK